MEHRIFKTEFAGRELSVEVGRYAEQANGHCVVRCGDTAVMVNVTMSKAPREGMDFFPLSVEFEEKQYSVGKIPGGFIRREGRPSEKAILTSRLIDRPIRPLFPKGFYNDVQVVATAMSVDNNIPPDIYAMIGSSVALSISDSPFAGPTGSVTVGLIDSCRQVKKVFRNRMENLRSSYGVFTANIVLKPGILPYMNRNLFVHRHGADLWGTDYKCTDSIMVHFYPPEKPHGKYADCIDILSPMDWSIIGEWDGMTPGTRGKEYEALKQKKLDECLDLLDARIHGIRSCIDKAYLSSPLTWHSYTSSPYGSAFGVSKDYHNPLTTFLSPRTPLPNLLLTGQSLNLHGILGVSKTAVITCGCILGAEVLEKEIQDHLEAVSK